MTSRGPEEKKTAKHLIVIIVMMTKRQNGDQ